MKHLAIFFSIYMCFLAVMPCRDNDDFGIVDKQNTLITQSHSADEQAGKETCTPFCSCSCCSTVRTVTTNYPIGTIFQQEIKKTFSEPIVAALPDQAISVWQPPQIS